MHPRPFLECSSHRSAVYKNNFGVVDLADQIIHQIGERLLRHMIVELVVGEAFTLFVVDVHVFPNILMQDVRVQPGQLRSNGL